jgi:hypothetical protein
MCDKKNYDLFHKGQEYQFLIDNLSKLNSAADFGKKRFVISRYRGNDLDDDFYLGRCYQFLLGKGQEIPESQKALIERAEEFWFFDLLEDASTEYYTHKLCSEGCGGWWANEKRCECGNVNMALNFDSSRVRLDRYDGGFYPDTC